MSSAVDAPSAAAGGFRQRRGSVPHLSLESQSHDRPRAIPQADGEVEACPSHNGAHETKAGKGGKTIGRTPDGTIFTVPATHDMVSQLLDPRQPKNLSDAIVLAVLAAHITLLYFLPKSLGRSVFAVVFLLWRAAYNVGIGLLLKLQSNDTKLVAWARKWKLFEKESKGQGAPPWLYRLLKRELEAKIPHDYKFDEAPIEYNTWLVFRRLVDLILMCDFVSYSLFAIACSHTPEAESWPMTVARWLLGWTLIGFNLWVKLDAHRVVSDFAWYWGDFFFLVDQELTFDGVFEMAPHPMYSIGYAGYYGISMIAASYSVLLISIVAHAAQFAFLVVVENPHIEKTYNPPTPRKRRDTTSRSDAFAVEVPPSPCSGAADAVSVGTVESPSQIHGLWGVRNLDFFRTTDYSAFLLFFYIFCLAFVTPSDPWHQLLFTMHALLWRVWYSVGLGVILRRQSDEKMWTRHFLKYGEDSGEAWRQWKGMYHISQILCYASFVAACWKLYALPPDWSYGFVLLRHVLGAGLVSIHVWTAMSIYDSLGEFGWFYGDFFFDHGAKLTYKSIYRFLNNPERVLGTAAFWGAALMSWNQSIFLLALVSHLLTLAFIRFVEQPHMQKIYGRSLRKEAGLTKFIQNSLPPPVKGWQSSVTKVVDGTSHFVEDFLEAARPKFASGVSTIVRDTTALFNNVPARLTLTRLSMDLHGLDPRDYSLTVAGESATDSAHTERATGKEGTNARFATGELKTMILQYGAPITVKWMAPARHSKRDWIGLYMVADNSCREATEAPSLGRWVPTTPGQYDSTTADKGIVLSDEPVDGSDSSGSKLVRGEVLFDGDKLWWTSGVFEFRYHHQGGHTVMAISQPFEIQIGRFDEEEMGGDTHGLYQSSIEAGLLPLVQNCFDRNPDIAPSTAEEGFGGHVGRDGKYAKRVVYAIHQMFGIEFAPAVVPADGNVRRLAWRICNAKRVLVGHASLTT